MSENLESHDELVCSECGRVLEEDQGREFDGRLLCDDCYRGGTVLCDHCGNRVWREDSEGDGDRVLCFHCYSNYFTTCDGCGLLIPNDEAYYDDDNDDDKLYSHQHENGFHGIAPVTRCAMRGDSGENEDEDDNCLGFRV